MPILFNNVAFGNGGAALYNGAALDAIKCGNTEVWRKELTWLPKTSIYTGSWAGRGNYTVGSDSMELRALASGTTNAAIWATPKATTMGLGGYSAMQITVASCYRSGNGVAGAGFSDYTTAYLPGDCRWSRIEITGPGVYTLPITQDAKTYGGELMLLVWTSTGEAYMKITKIKPV